MSELFLEVEIRHVRFVKGGHEQRPDGHATLFAIVVDNWSHLLELCSDNIAMRDALSPSTLATQERGQTLRGCYRPRISPGGFLMRRWLLASSISFALVMTMARPALALAPKSATINAERSLLDVKSDAKSGKIIATLPKPAQDGVSLRVIYISQLETGLGSAPTQLDFGAASNSRILAFRRIGKKIVADLENSKFITSNPAEQQTTE